MSINIIRWTIGNVSPDGMSCLTKSIKSFINVYGTNFNFYICYNNINKPKININVKINYIEQKNVLINGNGSIWKFSPPRINLDSYELFVDNDIVFVKKNNQLIEFFNNQKTIICEDFIRYYGKYDSNIQKSLICNAGLFGIPPNFNLENQLIKTWKNNNSYDFINSADEQGLTILTLSQSNFILIKNNKFIVLHPEGIPSMKKNILEFKKFDWHGDFFHFVNLNDKKKIHKHYKIYKSFTMC